MLYKHGNFYYLKFAYHKRAVYRNTRATTLTEARKREPDLRSEFYREQRERDQAAARFDCTADDLARCSECTALFPSGRGLRARDGKELCSDRCRSIWERRLNPIPTLTQFLENRFLPDVKKRAALRDKSNDYYHFGVRLLTNSDLGGMRIDEITSEHVNAYADALAKTKTRLNRKPSPSTINGALRTLRHALNKAHEWGQLAVVPKVRLAGNEVRRDRVVDDDEFALYSELCQQPWRDIAILIRYEGMRPGEIYTLRWEHLLFEANGGLILIVAGKTANAKRQLPMFPEVHAVLHQRYVAAKRPEAGWVFAAPTESGHVDGTGKFHALALAAIAKAHAASVLVKRGNWARQVAEVAGLDVDFVARHERAIRKGVPAFVPYSLRHTALTRLGEAGVDAFTLAKIAGHSTIAMTSRYVHPQAEAIRSAFEKVAERARLTTGGEISQPSTHKR